MSKRKNDGITHYDGKAPRTVSREMRKLVGTDHQIEAAIREETERQEKAAKEEGKPRRYAATFNGRPVLVTIPED